GHACVEARAQLVVERRVGGEPRVGERVRHEEEFPSPDRVLAEGDHLVGLGPVDAHAPREPLPAPVDETDQGNRRPAEPGGQTGDVVEGGLRRGGENVGVRQRPPPGRFVTVFGTRPHPPFRDRAATNRPPGRFWHILDGSPLLLAPRGPSSPRCWRWCRRFSPACRTRRRTPPAPATRSSSPSRRRTHRGGGRSPPTARRAPSFWPTAM